MRPIKHVEKGLTLIAGGLFNTIQSVNKYKPNPSFTPKWSDKPLLKSWQKSKPTLGWPRTTDSLCPNHSSASGVHTWFRVMLPAALPFVVTGMKQGWAFAWRSLRRGPRPARHGSGFG